MTDPDPLAVVHEVFIGEVGAWLVGGALRDRILGRPTTDLDLVVSTPVRDAAKCLAKAVRGPAFELSDEFGAWRVIARDRGWQADISPLRGARIEDDLALRDFTINAMAEPLSAAHPAAVDRPSGLADLSSAGRPGAGLVDPFGGRGDLAARVLRAVGPRSFADDPLRVLRLARFAAELRMTPEAATVADGAAHAGALPAVAAERVFVELKRLLAADEALGGLTLMERLGALEVVLPEVAALRGVEQTVYHHRDAYGHTLEVLEHVIALERDPQGVLGDEELGDRVAEFLGRPLADELTRGGGLRFAALLHDAAKPLTQTPNPKGGYGFPGHDRVGAELVEDVLGRLRTSVDLRRHVAAITRHHLRPGFLVHARPLPRRTIHQYLKATEPVEVDTLLLSVADRLATRGRKAEEAIAKHLELVTEVLPAALDWHEHGPPPPLVRGDELARELGVIGPAIGRLLAEIAEAQYAGDITTREEALALARAGA